MKIRKAHILARHVFNAKDNSAGIFFTKEDGGVDWLWSEETVGLFNNDVKDFRERGGQSC